MNKYIDADKLIAEIERLKSTLADPLCSQGNILGPDWVAGGNKMLNEVSSIIATLQQEQANNNVKEKAISLQIQAYLTTASDELYGPGKPLYTKEHHEGIHECMRMWQKMHQHYFSIKQEQPEVDLEEALDDYYKIVDWSPSEAIEYEIHKDIARHFYELGLNARKK